MDEKNFTTIKLKPDVSTIDFKKLDRINEPVNKSETMEINSLTKSGNYQLPSVEKIPDEGELQPFKKKLLGQRSQQRKKARILKMGEKLPQLPDKELVKKKTS